MFRFEHPEALWALTAIPVLLLVRYIYLRWRKRALLRFADAGLIGKLLHDVSLNKPRVKTFLQLAGFFFLIFAMANPQFGTKVEEVKAEGIDIMIALDISNSMLADDLTPNRLERSKRLITDLLEKLNGDRIGLVLFAGEAFVQLPLTTDYPAVTLFLSTVTPDLIATQGTAVGNAIDLCQQALKRVESKAGKVILVISDGENHEDDALVAAQEAKKNGMSVYTAGIGSVNGVPLYDYENGEKTGFKTDGSGQTVVTRLNEDLLRAVADAGNGNYIRITGSQSALDQLVSEFSQFEKSTSTEQEVTEYESHFQWLIALALLCWTADFFITRRKTGITLSRLFGGKGAS